MVDPIIDRFDLHFLIRKYFWMLLIVPLIFAILGVVYYLTQEPVYESSTVILVDPSFDRLIQFENVETNGGSNVEGLKSLEATLVSDAVVMRVVEKLNLRSEPGFLPSDLASLPQLPDAKLLDFLQKNRISATLQPETRLITISVLDPDPQRAQRIASTFSAEFEAFMASERRREVEKAAEQIREQSEEARQQALLAEKNLREFREKHGRFPVEQDHDLFSARMTEFGAELNAASRTRMQLQGQFESLEELDPGQAPYDILEIAGHINNAHVSDTMTSLSNSRARLSAAQEQFTAGHPAVAAAEAEVGRYQEQLSQLAGDVKSTVKANFLAAKNREQVIKRELEDLQGDFVEMKSASSEFRALQQETEGKWQLHQGLQTRLTESILSAEMPGNIVTVISEPQVPFKRAGISGMVYVLVGGVVGCMICGAWLLWKLLTGLPFTHSRQLEERLGLPVIADWSESDKSTQPLQSTGLLQYLGGSRNRTIQISAPGLNGKGNTVAVTVAQAAAHNGRRTLLLTIRPGVSDLQIRELGMSNLYGIEVSPEFVTRDPRFAEGFQRLKSDFDNIVVEAGAAQDEALVNWLSRLADQDVVVVGRGTSRKDAIADCIRHLSPKSDLPVALIMVDGEPRRTRHHEPGRREKSRKGKAPQTT